jgi:hypothetical protein
MNGACVREADGELVEVRTGVDPPDADLRERAFESLRPGGPERRDVAQAVGSDRREIDARGECQQRLVRADVARGLVASDVLLPRAKRHDERPLAADVRRHAHQAAGDLPNQLVRRGEDAQVGPAVLGRDPERLTFARRDVRAVRAGWREHRERDGLDDADEQRAGGVREAADLGHRLQETEEARLGRDDAGDGRAVREQPLERLEIRRSGGVAIRDERDVRDLEAALEVRGQRLPIVRMHAPGDEDPFPSGRTARHQRRFGGRGGPVVMRGADHVQVDQLRDQRFVLIDALERALADLRLVGRVRGVPLAAEEKLVDRRRRPMAIDARAQERNEIRPVPAGKRLQPCGELQLRLRFGQVQRACP